MNTVPTAMDAEFFVPANQLLNGDTIGTVTANDPDSGDDLSFEIQPATDPDGAFDIDDGGQLTVATPDAFTDYGRKVIKVDVIDPHGAKDTATIDVYVVGGAVTIEDVDQDEGSPPLGQPTESPFGFTAVFDGYIPDGFQLHYATQEFTATAGDDYNTTDGWLTFEGDAREAPEEQAFSVTVLSELNSVPLFYPLVEDDEVFFVNLDQLGNLHPDIDSDWLDVDNAAMGTIRNDDAAQISIDDPVMIFEGHDDTDDIRKIQFTVDMTAQVDKDIVITYDTRELSLAGGEPFNAATSDIDYVAAVSETVSIPTGSHQAILSVQLYGDRIVELDEKFEVVLKSVADAFGSPLAGGYEGKLTFADSTGLGAIDDDDYAFVWINGPGYQYENSSNWMEFEIELGREVDTPITVEWQTVEGTATNFTDFGATSGETTITGAKGTTPIQIYIYGDSAIEPHEDFQVEIISADADGRDVRIGSPGTGWIKNDDDFASNRTILAKRINAGILNENLYPVKSGEHFEVGGQFHFEIQASNLIGNPSIVRHQLIKDGTTLVNGQGRSFSHTFGAGDSGDVTARFYIDQNGNGDFDSDDYFHDSPSFTVKNKKIYNISAEVSSAVPGGATAALASLPAHFNSAAALLLRKDSASDYRAAVQFNLTASAAFTAGPNRPDPVISNHDFDKHWDSAFDFVFVSGLYPLDTLGITNNIGTMEVMIQWSSSPATLEHVIAHEVGHTVGLVHGGHTAPQLMAEASPVGSNELAEDDANALDN